MLDYFLRNIWNIYFFKFKFDLFKKIVTLRNILVKNY